jgi:hypothetical protein
MIRLTLALTLAVLVFSPDARADCCVGPPVNVVLAHWTPLTATLNPSVSTDETGETYGASIRADLKVGHHLIAKLDTVTVTGITPAAPQRVHFRVSARVRRDAARYGARAHHRHGTVTFIVTPSQEGPPQQGFSNKPYGDDGFVTLPR